MGLDQFDLGMLQSDEEVWWRRIWWRRACGRRVWQRGNFIFFFFFFLWYLLHLLFNPWSITFIFNPLGPRKVLVSFNQNIMLNALFSFLNRSFSVISEFVNELIGYLSFLNLHKFLEWLYKLIEVLSTLIWTSTKINLLFSKHILL